MNHSDRKVRDAIETICEELETAEAKISGMETENKELTKQVSTLEAQVDDLLDQNARLQGVINDLEQTLAETIMINGAK